MKRFFVALLLVSALAMQGQERIQIMLSSAKVPADASAEAVSALIADRDFTRNPGITVYKAEKPNGMAIIMCPGGGYVSQATGREGHDMAQWFNDMGITYVVLRYRLPQGDSNIPLADAEEAIGLVRRHAQEWGVNPARVGIMGASAGGHLASTLATHYSSAETRPDFQVLFYPVITMDSTYTHAGSRENLLGKNPSESIVAKFSNELQVDADTPKAFIMVSGDDDIVPVANSINYFNALAGNKVSASLHIYPDGGHGWGFNDSFTYKPEWTAELVKWLQEVASRE